MKGNLYIVSTPIGNLGDITMRAIETLKQADMIAAEDTRQTAKLKSKFGIDTPLISYHEHSDAEKVRAIIDMILRGKNIALVSDAGTPLISDPGSGLIKVAIEEDIQVKTIPGACALISALTLSGFDLSRFTFEGFIDRSGKKRKEMLRQIAARTHVTVIYESPNRVKKTLADLREFVEEERQISVSRELTKIYEQAIRGNIDEVLGKLEHQVKGEIVIVVDGAKNADVEVSDNQIKSYANLLLKEGLSKKDAVEKTAKHFEVSKNRVYKLILSL